MRPLVLKNKIVTLVCMFMDRNCGPTRGRRHILVSIIATTLVAVGATFGFTQASSATETPVGAKMIFRGMLPYSSDVPPADRYPEEVAIFAPASFSATESPVKIKDLILHLHGWLMPRDYLNGRLENFDDVLSEFKFDQILEASGRNAFLVVPSSHGHCDSFKSHLSPPARFSLFLKAIMNSLKLENTVESPLALTITGHSGAYTPIAAILDGSAIESDSVFSMIKEVDLLEATYGDEPSFASFALDPSKRFVSIFRPDTDTTDGSRIIWALSQGLDPAKVSTNEFYDASYQPDVTAAALHAKRTGFVMSDQDHWGTVNKYLPLVLKKVSDSFLMLPASNAR